MTGSSTRVALLRGINVGGHRKVPMADLRALAEDLGWQDVRTHVASGNLVFRAAGDDVGLASVLETALHDRIGVRTDVLVLPREEIAAALADCPFDDPSGKAVHVFFLWSRAEVDTARYDRLRAADETLVVDGHRAWLHTPSGIGRSKLAQGLGRVLGGVRMTGRNLATVRRIAEMLDAD